MKTSLLKLAGLALACALPAGAARAADAAGVTVCTFPGSPSQPLDTQVAMRVLDRIGASASLARDAIGAGDDDGVSLRELGRALQHKCDIIAGFPRSSVADAAGGGLLFSRPYLRAGFVSFQRQPGTPSHGVSNRLAATYGSPAQLIAVHQPGAELDLESTPADTVAAVASGKARSGIAWYPAVVAYQQAHPGTHFAVRAVSSDYADWQLVLAFGKHNAALRDRIDAALAGMAADGELTALTRAWNLAAGKPQAVQARQSAPAGPDRVVPPNDFEEFASPIAARRASQLRVLTGASATSTMTTMGPAFSKAQALHGQSVYAANCAKCHGDQLQGMNAPALQGPAFAPASHSTLTVGGIFNYMQSNMPADRPGKLKPQDYADVMAFLLMRNGYPASNTQLTAGKAQADQTPLVSHSAQ